MKDKEEYTDLFLQRRDYFQRNFKCKVSGRRNDVERKKKFKNSCPVCGYLTLQERDSFDICTICLWEDDGYDDLNAHEESGPNHMTLIEGREIFQKAKRKLVAATEEDNKLIHALKIKFLTLDRAIEYENVDRFEIVSMLNEVIDLLVKNKIYGLENLFEK